MIKKYYILILLITIMSLNTGCKLLENSEDKVTDACYVFDGGFKGNAYKLDCILTKEFIFNASAEFSEQFGLGNTSFNREEFINLTNDGLFNKDSLTAYSEVIISGVTASVDMEYRDYDNDMVFEVSLRDEGDFFFISTWRISNLYLKDLIAIHQSTTTASGEGLQLQDN